MKTLITLLFTIACLISSGQQQSDKNRDDTVEILLSKVKSKTISESDKKKLTQIAFDIQNTGQILDEHYHNFKGSLYNVKKAIIIFHALNDTLNEANNRKFKGYLLGRFGEFSKAKKEIQIAIDLFTSKNKDWGVAVSQFDLSKVYEFEHKIDSAIYYCNITIEFWKSKPDVSRVFISQNMLINLFLKSKEFKKAKLIQKQTELQINPEFHWQLLIDFYFLSMRLYKETKETKLFNLYQNRYYGKIADLKQKGISAKTYYEDN